jgi:hypothetical protein
MLMGLPEDYWEQEFIETVLGPYTRVVDWDNYSNHLTRQIVRARVVDLECIPHFTVFSDSPGYEGQSWTVQCEILQHENLGIGPLMRSRYRFRMMMVHRFLFTLVWVNKCLHRLQLMTLCSI